MYLKAIMETLIKIIKTLISFFKKKDNVIENLEKEEKIMEDKKEDSLDITFEKSPNYNSREGEKISLVVLHWTAGKFKGSLSWLKDKRAQASAHYVISKEGKIVQIVKEEDKAWHCGYSYLKGYASDLNKCSIGI
jgi:N-acetyl-anhydromuramyl-L-alanine amidase AmpD